MEHIHTLEVIESWAKDNHIEITNKQYQDFKDKLKEDTKEEYLIQKYLKGKTTRKEEQQLLNATLKFINELRIRKKHLKTH